MQNAYPVWILYIIIAVCIIFLIGIFIEYRIIRKLRSEIRFHKRIIETKTKSMTSGKNRPLFERSLIFSFDAGGIITSVNDAFTEFLGFSKDDIIGKHVIKNLIPEKDSSGNNMSKIVEHFIANPKLYIDIETEVMAKSKERKWISWTNRAIYDEQGDIKSFTCVGFDITSRKMLEKELEELSSADVIKGVFNKATFVDVGNKELMRAIRYNRHLSVVVFVVHRSGKNESLDDVFLQDAVDVCKDLIRDCDYIGRIGDNEFALLLPETKIASSQILIDRIKSKVITLAAEDKNPFAIDSINAAEKVNSDDSIDDLIIRAFDGLQKISVS